MSEVAAIDEAVGVLRARCPGFEPVFGVVLGSGLGRLADEIENPRVIPFAEIPGAPRSTVDGHRGRVVVGRIGGLDVAVLEGRVHLYEGYPATEAVFLVRALVRWGVRTLLVTNAAGGINPDFSVPDLMLIRDHINLSGHNALVGPNLDPLGVRFPDMSEAYDRELSDMVEAIAIELGIGLRQGVYAGVLGPSYETPAEVRMLRVLGADAVGMSTVNEVIAARHMGARVIGVSCISNQAAGLGRTTLVHSEVKAAAMAVQDRLTKLVRALASAIAAQSSHTRSGERD